MKTQKKSKNILILHGWDASYKDHWFLKAKELFAKQGWETFIPQLPGDYFPKKEEWLEVIEQYQPDETWILIGHSLGGVAILKYLEIAIQPIKQAILIATPFEEMEFTPIKNFFENDFDWQKIKNNCPKFDIVNEANDSVVDLEDGKKFSEKLSGKLHVLPGFSHFHNIDLGVLERLII